MNTVFKTFVMEWVRREVATFELFIAMSAVRLIRFCTSQVNALLFGSVRVHVMLPCDEGKKDKIR